MASSTIYNNLHASPPSLSRYPLYILIYASIFFIPYVHLLQLRHALQKYDVLKTEVESIYNNTDVPVDSTAQKKITMAFESHKRFQDWCRLAMSIGAFTALAISSPVTFLFMSFLRAHPERDWSNLETLVLMYAFTLAICSCAAWNALHCEEEALFERLGPAFLVIFLNKEENIQLHFFVHATVGWLPMLGSVAAVVTVYLGRSMSFHLQDITLHPMLFGITFLLLMILAVSFFVTRLQNLMSSFKKYGPGVESDAEGWSRLVMKLKPDNREYEGGLYAQIYL